MGKRKHRDEEDSADEVELGTKRKRTDGENGEESDTFTNGFNNITIQNGDDSSRFEVYLIKKPISMEIEELEKLKWSFDDEVLAKSKIKTSTGSYRAIVSTKSKKERMIHVPAIKEIRKEDARNIKAAGVVHGSITILPAEVKKKLLGGLIYEEGEEASEDVLIHPNLQKIKKEAHLELDSRKQRNKAYGTTTDSEGNERKLPELLIKKKIR